jgi:glutaminyl-tRNA synthetase
LKHAYIVTCHDFVKDENGHVTEVHCTYVPNSKSGEDTSGLKVKGTIHWISVPHAKEAEVRLYDRLFNDENPAAAEDFKASINLKAYILLNVLTLNRISQMQPRGKDISLYDWGILP